MPAPQASAIKKGAKGHAKERLHRALHEAKEEEARQKKAGERALAEAPVGPPPPEPPGTLPLKSTALAHDFMSVWAFAGSFMSTLLLQPFSPEELCAALQRPGESVLLAELHVRLRVLQCESLTPLCWPPAPLRLGKSEGEVVIGFAAGSQRASASRQLCALDASWNCPTR